MLIFLLVKNHYCWYICKRLWVVAYKSLKIKKKSSWVIPKVVKVLYKSSCLWGLFITKLKSQFKQGFTMVVITIPGVCKCGCKESSDYTIVVMFSLYELKHFIYVVYLHKWDVTWFCGDNYNFTLFLTILAVPNPVNMSQPPSGYQVSSGLSCSESA